MFFSVSIFKISWFDDLHQAFKSGSAHGCALDVFRIPPMGSVLMACHDRMTGIPMPQVPKSI